MVVPIQKIGFWDDYGAGVYAEQSITVGPAQSASHGHPLGSRLDSGRGSPFPGVRSVLFENPRHFSARENV
jgi:hypothetical protein